MITSLKRYVGDELVSVSSVTKPTNLEDGARLYEADTRKVFIKSGNAWVEMGTGAGGGSVLFLASSGSGLVFQFRVKEIGADWLRCKSWDGSNETGNDIYVGKSYELRRTPWDGQTVSIPVEGWQNEELVTGLVDFTYTYHSNNLRTVEWQETGRLEAVWEPFIPNRTIIYAGYSDKTTSITDPSSNPVRFMDINNAARIWSPAIIFTGLSGTIEEDEFLSQGHVPLDQAIYYTGTDKIYGIRGGHLYKFNATNGGLEQVSKFSTGIRSGIWDLGESCMTMHSGYLYAVYSQSHQPENWLHHDYLIKLDPSTLGVQWTRSLRDYGVTTSVSRLGVVRRIDSVQHNLYLWFYDADNSLDNLDVRRFNPNVTGLVELSREPAISNSWAGVTIFDGTGVWQVGNGENNSPGDNDGRAYLMNFNHTNSFFGSWEDSTVQFPLPFLGYGIARTSTTGLYVTTASDFLVKAIRTGVEWFQPGSVTSTLSLGTTGEAPVHIHYHSGNNKLYIPLYRSNRVAIVNVANDTISFATGFDSPWDIVSTTGKIFAVQHGRSGLREIT